MASSTASKDRKEKKDNSNKQQANEIKDAVNKRLGLTKLPNTPPPGQKWGGMDSPTSKVALNLKGKDRWMYGKEASKFTNDEMVKRNLVKVGNYFRQEGGNFVRISKEEGEKLYAAGDKSISRSVIGNTNALKIKYGSNSGTNNNIGAMGSCDPTGAMTSIPISRKMLESQNKAQAIIGLAMGAVMPGLAAIPVKIATAQAAADVAQPGAAYEDYTKKFDATQQGKKFTSQRNLQGVLKLGFTKGKKSLKDKLGI